MVSAPRSVTKTEAAFRALRQEIEDGRYHPGEHLRVQRMIEDLRMSPTPIREALRLLQSEGLVVHHAHRGMTVAEYSPEDAEEVYRAAGACSSRWPPSWPSGGPARADRRDAPAARRAGRRPRRLLRAPSAAELNAAWHRAIYNACASRYLQEFISRLWQAIPMRAVWLTGRARPVLRAARARDDRHRARATPRPRPRACASTSRSGRLSTIEHLRTLGRAGEGGPA